MNEYGKTENLFRRDPDTHKLIVDPSEYRMPEVGLVDPYAWIATEKVDGTNVRVIVSIDQEGNPDYVLKGRSDAANLPKDLSVDIEQSKLNDLYEVLQLPDDVVITFYGEAFGAGIQKGGMYSPDKHIAVFDLMTSRAQPAGELPRVCKGDDHGLTLQSSVSWSHAWRSWEECQAAADLLGLYTAPLIYTETSIEEMVEDVRQGFESVVGDRFDGSGGPVEGVVAKTSPYLYNGRGNRIMFKLKTKDLA